jgi:hypothetical protein
MALKVSFLSFVAGIGREVNVSLTSENGAKGMSDIERSELATASLRPDWQIQNGKSNFNRVRAGLAFDACAQRINPRTDKN